MGAADRSRRSRSLAKAASWIITVLILGVFAAVSIWLVLLRGDRLPVPPDANRPAPRELSPTPDPDRAIVEGPADAAAPDRAEEMSPRPDAKPPVPRPDLELIDEPEILTSRFFGVVVDDEDRSPVRLATVRPAGAGEEIPSVVTTGDGSFELPPVPIAIRAARIDADRYGPALFRIDDDHDTPEKALEIRLRPAARLEVRLEGGTGLPLPDHSVRLTARPWAMAASPAQGFAGSDVVWNGTTDLAGECVFPELPPEISLDAEILRMDDVVRRIETPVVLKPREIRSVTWVVGGGSRVTGILLDQDEVPIPSCRLWLARRIRAGEPAERPAYFDEGDDDGVVNRANTDRDGRFEIASVPPGRWWLGPAAARRFQNAPSRSAAGPLAIPIDVPEGVDRDVTLRTGRGLYIRGTVVAPDGSVLERTVTVQGIRAGTLGFVMARTEENGSFALGPLAPGAHEIRALGFGSSFVSSDSIEARSGEEGVVLRLREGGSIRGVVLDATGSSVPGASVMLSADPPVETLQMTTTRGPGGDPGFVFTGLESGVYHVSAVTSSGSIGFVSGIDLTAGTARDDIEIRVSPGGRLRIRYEGPTEYAQYRVQQGSVAVAADGIQSGTSDEVFVPPGLNRVSLRIGRELVGEETVVVRVGAAAEVEFSVR